MGRAESLRGSQQPARPPDSHRGEVDPDALPDVSSSAQGALELIGQQSAAANLALCGTWASATGQCSIHTDAAGRLWYQEALDSGKQMIRGRLLRSLDRPGCWLATVTLLSVGGESEVVGDAEVVGDIEVRSAAGCADTMRVRIRVAEEDEDWQETVLFRRLSSRPAHSGSRKGRSRRSAGRGHRS